MAILFLSPIMVRFFDSGDFKYIFYSFLVLVFRCAVRSLIINILDRFLEFRSSEFLTRYCINISY